MDSPWGSIWLPAVYGSFNSIEWIQSHLAISWCQQGWEHLSIPLNGFVMPKRGSLERADVQLSIPLNGFPVLESVMASSVMVFQFHWTDSTAMITILLFIYIVTFNSIERIRSSWRSTTWSRRASFNSIERIYGFGRGWSRSGRYYFQFHWTDSSSSPPTLIPSSSSSTFNSIERIPTLHTMSLGIGFIAFNSIERIHVAGRVRRERGGGGDFQFHWTDSGIAWQSRWWSCGTLSIPLNGFLHANLHSGPGSISVPLSIPLNGFLFCCLRCSE